MGGENPLLGIAARNDCRSQLPDVSLRLIITGFLRSARGVAEKTRDERNTSDKNSTSDENSTSDRRTALTSKARLVDFDA
jgi:hypothetical protein